MSVSTTEYQGQYHNGEYRNEYAAQHAKEPQSPVSYGESLKGEESKAIDCNQEKHVGRVFLRTHSMNAGTEILVIGIMEIKLKDCRLYEGEQGH